MAKRGKEMAVNQTSDGNSPAIEVEGYSTIFYEGGLGGGIAKLQISRDGVSGWGDVADTERDDTALTGDLQYTVFTPRSWIRTNLTGATAPTFTSAAVPAAVLIRSQ